MKTLMNEADMFPLPTSTLCTRLVVALCAYVQQHGNVSAAADEVARVLLHNANMRDEVAKLWHKSLIEPGEKADAWAEEHGVSTEGLGEGYDQWRKKEREFGYNPRWHQQLLGEALKALNTRPAALYTRAAEPEQADR